MLKEFYFLNNNTLEAKCGSKSSLILKSFMWGKEIICKGYRLRIGDGTKVRIMEDPWIPRDNSFKFYDKPTLLSNLYVADFKITHGCWKENFIRRVFNDDDANLILSNPSEGWDLEDII